MIQKQDTGTAGQTTHKFDPQALKQKYAEERAKRLHPDAHHQYHKVSGSFSHYAEDPYVTTPLVRDSIDEECDVLVIGGGYGGLLIAARLAEVGITNVRIVEKAGDFGGTWYWNRYPGAACDIESYIYMPLLEALQYTPTEKYAHGPELFEYAKLIGRHFGLYEKTLFQTQVVKLEWDEASLKWSVETQRGDRVHARFVTSAGGPLHTPKLPGVPDIEDFQGHSFHTSRWDYDYTGGFHDGALTGLADKRVGVIGTGATAVQIVPQLGNYAKHLYVFQRTPSSVDKRKDGITNVEWYHSLPSGWQKRRMENFNAILDGRAGEETEDLVGDGWTDTYHDTVEASKLWIERELGDRYVHDTNDDRNLTVQYADFKKMNAIRARIDDTVPDPETAEKLKPWYNRFCKRPCFHDHYLPTFNKPNVTLVDTNGKGVDGIKSTGVVAAGEEYAIDCLIFATGFETSTDYSQRTGMEIIGRNGLKLTDKWAHGPITLMGLNTRDFPNLFIISRSQSGQSPNFVHMEDEQAQHVAYMVSECRKRGIVTVEPTKEAENGWVDTIVRLSNSQKFKQECTPGYYNLEGSMSEESRKSSAYGLGSVAFFEVLRGWRERGDMEGLKVRYA